MRRSEFIDNYNSIDDLISFCIDEGYDNLIENYYNEDAIDDYLQDLFSEKMRYDRWYEVRDEMNSVPEGYEWYIVTDSGEIYGVEDREEDDLKSEILEILDNDDFWEDEIDDCEEELIEEECVIDEDAELFDFEEVIFSNMKIISA